MRRASLIELAVEYFRKSGYKVERDVVFEGASGIPRKVDIFIQKGREKRLVWVKDWKRTVGVNMVINADKFSTDIGFSRPIVVSQKFSGHAKAYANRRGVLLITKREIARRLR